MGVGGTKLSYCHMVVNIHTETGKGEEGQSCHIAIGLLTCIHTETKQRERGDSYPAVGLLAYIHTETKQKDRVTKLLL